MARTSSPPRTSIRRSPPAQRHSSSSTATTITSTNTTTTSTTSRSLASQRTVDRPNIPIAPASSNTSSPIYSTTSSPPISPGISQYPGTSLSTMAPSRSDSRSTALAMELAPTSTPTGRISKAKKGKRVHACEFPGCGKIFTRAEHRRRHELNHNPDASYRCQQQGCGKSFHRLDLLQRHQERHELEASTQPSSPNGRRYPTQSAVLSESAAPLPPTSMASPQIPQPPSRTQGGIPIPSIMNPTSYSTDPAAFGNYPHLIFTSAESWDPVYVTYTPHSHRSDISSTSSVASFDPTSSPMVAPSMPQATWTQAPPPNVLPANMFETDGMSPYPPMATVNAQPIPLSDLDGHEWTSIGRELSAVSGLLPSATRNGVSERLRWHCLDLYWQYFHPTYPIVHRPTFLIGTQPPPLLACAMVAIGSYYDTREDAKQYSLALLEIATKILRLRPSSTSKNHKARIVDLQTVVLLEILSTFCARQISVQMSSRFRSLFANLNQSTIAPPLAVFRVLKQDRSANKLAEAQKFWIENETRSRILHACSVLDSQQTILFDQEPTVRRPRVATTNMKQVNLPCDDNLWDASPVEKWAEIAAKHEYIPLIGGKPLVQPGKQAEFSYFQQQVINANCDGQLNRTPPKQNISVTSNQMLAKSEFDYHAASMCKHTPIRKLLTVTGESWLLGRKVERKADYERAKKDLRKWLETPQNGKKSYSDCTAAHWHALKLLRILYLEAANRTSPAEIFGTTHMLHENWVIYLATLVCWVQGQRKPTSGVAAYNIQRIPGTQGLVEVARETVPTTNGAANTAVGSNTSCLNNPDRAANDAEAYFIFTNVSNPAALQDLEPAVLSRTQGLLESVRTQKIQKHMMGGLMNDAEQVLLKLVEGNRNILSAFDET